MLNTSVFSVRLSGHVRQGKRDMTEYQFDDPGDVAIIGIHRAFSALSSAVLSLAVNITKDRIRFEAMIAANEYAKQEAARLRLRRRRKPSR